MGIIKVRMHNAVVSVMYMQTPKLLLSTLCIALMHETAAENSVG